MPKDVIGKILIDPQIIPDWMRHEVPAQPPTHDPEETPSRCYRINNDYIPFLVALTDYYVWPDAFSGDEATRVLAAERFVNLQILLMMGNINCIGDDEMYLLRPSPTDACVLEQSIDGGLSWTTAFDYRRCFVSQRTFTEPELNDITINANAEATALAAIYLDNPLNIFADGTFDEGPDDEYRNGSMCYALNLLVMQLSQMAEGHIDHGIDWWDVAHMVAVAVRDLGVLILSTAGAALTTVKPEWALAVAVATGLAKWAADWTETEGSDPDLSPILDSDVQQALVCCAMESLQGNTPSVGLFSAMFNTCDIPDLNADTQSFLNWLIEIEDVYLMFLEMCQKGFEALADGQVFNCGCGDELIRFDFRAESGSEPNTLYGQQDWVVAGHNPGCGVYTTTIGWVQGNETGEDYTKHRGVGIYHPISGTISRVRVNFDIALSNYIDGGKPSAISYGSDQRLFTIVETGNGNDRWIERVASRSLSSDNLLCEVYCYIRGTTNPQWAGTVVIKQIEVYGSGLSPS
jgi:hypothetical protein